MAEVGSAFVSLMPSTKGFGSATEKQIGGEMGSSGKKIGSKFGTAMKFGALAAVGGALAVGKFLSGAIGEAREAQVIGARTENVIKKMGNAAGISAKQVGDLAGKISLKTGVDDEAIQSGQNLLLTFGNIKNEAGKGNDIFSQTSQLMVDMSAAMGTDAKGSAIQLGKALNDPVKGLTALSRVGVSFTKQQQKQITKLAEGGKTMAAQKIILGELDKQFGGAAAAMATPAEKVAVAWGNVKEQIGTKLLPVVDGFLNMLLGAMPTVTRLVDSIGPAFGRLKTFLAPVAAAVQGAFGGGGGGGLMATLTQVADTVRANFLPIIQTVATTFTSVVIPAVTSLVTYLAAKLFPVFQQVWSIISTKVLPIYSSLARFFYGTLVPAILGIVAAVVQNLKPVFDQLVATVQAKVLPAISNLLAKFREWQPTIQRVILVVVKIVGWVLKLAATILAKVLPILIRFAGFLIGVLFSAIGKVIGIIVRIVKFHLDFWASIVRVSGKVKEFATTLRDLAQNGLDKVLSAVSALPGKIIALGARFGDAGRAIIGKFIDGLKGAGGLVADIAGNVWDAVKGLLNSAISQINAALEFTISLPGPNISINPPNIPSLASGGIATRSTLALIGEGRESEAVMPLSKLSAMLDRERSAALGTGGSGARRLTLVVGNREFDAYVDERVGSLGALGTERARAR